MVYGDSLDKYFALHWVWEGVKKTFDWGVQSLIIGNYGFILPAAWVVGLFLLKPTRTYSIGACGLWLLFQM